MSDAEIFPEAKGFIFYDPQKCAGCKSCMLACSMVHEGKHNLSLSRIQILDSPFGQFPTDITITPCLQCKYPLCVEVCPVEALHIDKEHLNVRRIDEQKCIGCKRCIKACPFTPSRITWNPEKQKSMKCDLCKDPPFWDEKGKPACVEVCPTGALMFSSKPPSPPGYKGYIVNLRGEGWKRIGMSVNGGNQKSITPPSRKGLAVDSAEPLIDQP